jgi:histidyl-tRNA synthetase
MMNAMKNKKTKPVRKASPRAPQTLKGFRDFLPEEMRIRQLVLKTFREVAESFGFEPLQTPSLEYAATLLGKYGAEADRLVYTFKDRGGRDVGLIYDLTVPTARVLAQYGQQISKPFKRYQIQRVWRAEKPQRGRFREFVQCDFDIFGVDSPLADAEVIALTYNILAILDRKEVVIKVNSRPLLFSTLEQIGISDKNQQLDILRIIDKLDKKSEQEIIKELESKALLNFNSGRLLSLVKSIKPDEKLSRIFEYLEALGVDMQKIKFDPTLVRGLDYYTGIIFEDIIEGQKGSVAGGGRYDELIEQFGGPPTPAVGASLGLDRIVEALQGSDLQKATTTVKALVTIFDPPLTGSSLKLAQTLRASGVNVELYPDPTAKLEKQIKYADRKGIPYVIIIGPEEARENKVTVKDLRSGEQKTMPRKDLIANFQ